MVTDISPELAAIITPGTDDDIVAMYASLADRAQTAQFGLLEDDVVVVDTETTGLDFKDCELIELAAARLRGNQIVDTMDLFVKPSKPIPAEIVAITGIDNDTVADADDAATVVGKFIEFAGDAPLIAHNAVFDSHFIKKGNGGDDVGSCWVDSLELSRIVLPCLSSYKLHDLSRAFGLHQSTHRAIDDVVATCGLWRVLLCAAHDLPAGLLDALASMHRGIEWPYRPIFAQMAAMKPDVPFSLVDARADRCGRLGLEARDDALSLVEEAPLVIPAEEEIEADFALDGCMGQMFEGYEPRKEQLEMACEVARAFATSKKVAIEAGTGVGKSMAYLLPAAKLAQRNKITVGIATKSNALTDQLINQELPVLSSMMDKPLVYTALKGYDNYPCMRKVSRLLRRALNDDGTKGGSEERKDDAAEKGIPSPSVDLLNALAAICTYSVQTAQGDINCLGIKWGKLQRGDFTSAPAECQKRRCPFFPGRCFLHLARRRAAASDIVVTNHSLLFRQIGSDIEILPPIRYWVVDEAHSAESEARRQWALKVDSREVSGVFDIMGGTSTGALGTLFKEARDKSGATLMLGLLTKTASECARASIAGGLFFDDLKAFCRKQARGRSSYDTETIWIDHNVRSSQGFARVAESGASFRDILSKAISCGMDAVKSMTDVASGDSALLDRLNELTGAIGGLVAVRDALNVSVDGTDTSYVYSAVASQKTGFESYALVAERLDVGSELAQMWYPNISSVVYSSATIAVGDTFDHFARGVGLDKIAPSSYSSLRLDSSYDFDANMGIVVATDLPDPTKQKDAYLAALAPLLVDVHLAMGGSVLTLFTNRAEMDRMFELVEPELARHGLELASQCRGSNVRRLREHFVAEKSSSLFALKSFWEGFDAQGDTLRCVVIPRLPFTPPTDPLSQERKLREGGAAWRNHDLPESVIAFKQATGRLIRSSTDRGCLVLADPRLKTMWYGKVFLASLPKREYEAVSSADVGRAVSRWA